MGCKNVRMEANIHFRTDSVRDDDERNSDVKKNGQIFLEARLRKCG